MSYMYIYIYIFYCIGCESKDIEKFWLKYSRKSKKNKKKDNFKINSIRQTT